ncbi:hypothetical protein CDL12_14228 [Handroanthus impetiginosus]|uniref:Protein PLASTID REDOX INSENSITIVE 2, chloroplastic n=1 Tax=Handroanthus impetiginosus TaxID=429701 RepID=A0A2G9H6K7_9LAMI|nr:hypothetical protein CDL12_14228 [Handroanthus impetiginosus]
MASAVSAAPSLLHSSPSSSSSKFLFTVKYFSSVQVFSCRSKTKRINFHTHSTLNFKGKNRNFICKAEKEYKFPDPIPEFAESETEKFRTHLHKKLSKKDIFGDSVDEVVGICTKIFNEFLHTEYGGPGTLLVMPFIDMADTLNERGLPGGPQAARAAVKWAQNHVDKDWKEWNGS